VIAENRKRQIRIGTSGIVAGYIRPFIGDSERRPALLVKYGSLYDRNCRAQNELFGTEVVGTAKRQREKRQNAGEARIYADEKRVPPLRSLTVAPVGMTAAG
jgi:hypothetical protein